MVQQALTLLKRNSVDNADMIYPLLRGEAEVLKADEDGVMIVDHPSGLCFASLPDTDGSVQKLMAIRRLKGYVLHSDALADRFQRVVHKPRVLRVTQVVYEGKTAPHVARVCSVRRLTSEDADEFCSVLPYDDEEEMRQLIGMGRIYGAFINDTPAGRIGLHPEGCMGLLDVNPAFRRRGVGEMLEAYLIKELLSAGITPFGQIVRTNEASLALSRKLGLSFSREEISILY